MLRILVEAKKVSHRTTYFLIIYLFSCYINIFENAQQAIDFFYVYILLLLLLYGECSYKQRIKRLAQIMYV